MVSFAQPLWILCGAVGCLLLWLLWARQDIRRRKQLESFAAPALVRGLTANVSGGRRTAKKLLVLGGVFCCFLALARPQYGFRWIDVTHKGIDILFALDTSRSMLAEDVRPNRLERSKFAIMDFVSQLSGDRVGLLPFAGSSYLMCPLTSDYRSFEQSLMAVDTSIIPTGGTDISHAISSAGKILNNEANHKILIMITDGENLQGNAVKAAIEAHKEGMTIYTLGVGTKEGELIPDPGGGFIRDRSGAYVKSRLDVKALNEIAGSAGGFYTPLGAQGQGLQTIYREKLSLVPKEELAERRSKVPIERFEWPLAAALFLMSIEYLLSGRKPEHSLPRSLARFTGLSKRSLVILIPSLLFAALHSPHSLQASTGETAYESGDYQAASDFYQQLLQKDPEKPELLFNSGTTAYKNEHFVQAAAAFDKALATDDIELQKKAYFNKGNALFRQGERTLQTDGQSTVHSWEQALEAFDSTLALDPENENARFNYDLVKARLEELKKQQNQQQNSPQQQNDDKKSSSDDKKKQDSGAKNDSGSQDTKADTGDKKPADDSAEKQSAPPQEQSETGNDSSKDNKESDKPATDADLQESAEQQGNGKASSATEPGKMTTEEAEKLLKAVQGEEGRLNLFAPGSPGTKDEQQRDW